MLTPTSLERKNDNEYDAFRHLSRALFWAPDVPIVTLNFYADDSNKSKSDEYIHIAAYVGLEAQWQTFCFDWRLRLVRAGLTWFHAGDFFNGAREFKSWESKERAGERKILLRDLAGIIDRGSLFNFICIVHVPTWRKINQEYLLKEELLTPYSLASRTIIQMAREWATDHGHNKIHYVFDQGFEDWGILCDRLYADFGFRPIPANKREVRPVQAADWLAYESGREAPQYINETSRKRPTRESFLGLLKGLEKSRVLSFHTESAFRKLCKDPRAAIPKRTKNV
jgi:Protein of unknown function (DUF3800)